MHAPCHACPLPCMPPAMHAPCHACPLPHMPPCHAFPPAMHAPSCHACPLPHMSPAMHAPWLPCMPPQLPHMPPAMYTPYHAHHACPPATHAPPPPTVDRILGTRFWKYYLAPTSLRAVKIYVQLLMFIQVAINYSQVFLGALFRNLLKNTDKIYGYLSQIRIYLPQNVILQ